MEEIDTVLEVHESRLAPQSLPDFFARHQSPGALCQQEKHPERLWL
jgi:hypothetical protein